MLLNANVPSVIASRVHCLGMKGTAVQQLLGECIPPVPALNWFPASIGPAYSQAAPIWLRDHLHSASTDALDASFGLWLNKDKYSCPTYTVPFWWCSNPSLLWVCDGICAFRYHQETFYFHRSGSTKWRDSSNVELHSATYSRDLVAIYKKCLLLPEASFWKWHKGQKDGISMITATKEKTGLPLVC